MSIGKQLSPLVMYLACMAAPTSLSAIIPEMTTAVSKDWGKVSPAYAEQTGQAAPVAERPLVRVAQAQPDLHALNQQVITEFRANQGKVGGRYANTPLLLLTTTGAKSGRTVTNPLAYTRDGKRLVVIASFGGAPKNPSWYHNVVAHSVATVELGSERFQVKATVATGEERQRLYDQQAAQLPAFAEYQKKTTRQIPVVVLTRLD